MTVTRKLDPGMPATEARADVRDLLAWKSLPLTHELTVDAWELEDRLGLSFWDALIVAAARAQSCTHLLTEDLQDGLDLGGLIVTNPFNSAPPKGFEAPLPDDGDT